MGVDTQTERSPGTHLKSLSASNAPGPEALSVHCASSLDRVVLTLEKKGIVSSAMEENNYSQRDALKMH